MQPETLSLSPGDEIPNNPDLPVLIYRGGLGEAGAPDANAAEALLGRNGWPAEWRGGIFSYHHFHSTAHEALAVIAGRAQVILGGAGGPEVTLRAGDLVVLPAGTGHCLVEGDENFLVVGAYPEGQEWDLQRGPADDAMKDRIAAVPRPVQDPLSGGAAPLPDLWGGGI